jgi:hypothetical protein
MDVGMWGEGGAAEEEARVEVVGRKEGESS